MTKMEALKDTLKSLAELSKKDREFAHRRADETLLDYVNDPEVEALFKSIRKWYS